MPNIQLKEALADCKSPLVMVTLSAGEVASRRTELRAFTDGDLTTVTNATSMFSMIDGSALTLIKNTNPREVANAEFDSLDDLVTMKSSESEQLIGVDPDLAFAIAGEKVFCPITGKENATMEYIDVSENAADGEDAEEVIIDASEEDDEEDMGDIDDSAMNGDDSVRAVEEQEGTGSDEPDEVIIDDETDDGDSDEDDEVLDVASFGTKARKILPKSAIRVSIYETAEATDPVVDGSLVSVVNDDTFVVSDDKGSNFTVKATDVSDGDTSVKIVGTPSSVESATVKVTIAETVDPEIAGIRLVNLAHESNSEIAVFIGGSHIGTLHRSRASEKAAELYNNGNALFQAFKPTLKQHYHEQASSELAKFGYVPNTVDVKVGDLFERRLAHEVAKVTTKAETASAERVGDMTSNLELAFMGLNKGLLKGDNDLVVAIASAFRRAGVVKPEREARKLLALNSKGYVRSAVEHAKIFSTKTPDYLNGMTQTLANADFVVSESEVEKETVISTAMDPGTKTVAPQEEKQTEIAGFISPKTPEQGNKYNYLFRH